MKTPGFWRTKNILSTLLLPVSAVYGMASALQRATITPTTLPIPVICIGNATAGGAGKTPVALHIGQKLKEKNIPAFFLSRGYGGRLPGPVRVDPERHTADDVGDEPLLLARLLPTIVAKDRVQGARFAIEQGAKAIIMDDGFQNPSLAKTLSLLVVDGQTGFGNGRLLPAGPLREPVASALKRAQAVIILNTSLAISTDKPILTAMVQPVAPLTAKTILPFCGLASPQKFFSMLAGLGVRMAEPVAFSDHYPYKASDLETLAAKARQAQATLVTTAKDAVRLPASFRSQVTVVDIALAFDDEARLDRLLDSAWHEKT